MEELISKFSKTLAPFCNHLQSSCDALKQSVDRRPIPLDSASSTFIQSLNRRVSTVSVDLNLLESMSLETVSFEELLGHVSEVYKKNENGLLELQNQLRGVGYVPEFEIDEEDKIYDHVSTSGLSFELSNSKDESNVPSSYQRSISTTGLAKRSFEEDILLDDSLSLQNAGLSDVCLASLASEGNSTFDDPYVDFHTPKRFLERPLNSSFPCQSAVPIVGVSEGEGEDNLKFEEAILPPIKLSKDDYESLPSYMKGLASWEKCVFLSERICLQLYFISNVIHKEVLEEGLSRSLRFLVIRLVFRDGNIHAQDFFDQDLIVAVEKINSCLEMKAKEQHYILQDEISSMDLGHKARSFLLLLVRMKRVVVETVDGQISYRVV